MRSTNHACVLGLLLVFGAACGADHESVSPLVVKTRLARSQFAAGERIAARCDVLDAAGGPALDARGNLVAVGVAFTILYEDSDAFAVDAEHEVIAARAGAAIVRCTAPALGRVALESVDIQIVAGAPSRAVTQLAAPLAVAGEPVDATCLVFDAFGNPVTDATQSLAMSPLTPGSEATTTQVTATAAGAYQVSCVIGGAADVAEDVLIVVPAVPSSLVAVVSPERPQYAVHDQVALVAEAHDRFGNRVDDVALQYAVDSGDPQPGAQFQLDHDGRFLLSATVTSPTDQNVRLRAERTVVVNSSGPTITCMRADAPDQPADAYMLQRGASTLVVPVRISDAFAVQSVAINNAPAALDPSTGNYQAAVPIDFGMTFVDVVATDQFGVENSTTCTVLAAPAFTPETANLPGSIDMRLDPDAIDDHQPTGLNSINDILHTVLASDQLRSLVDGGLVAANPINGGDCGFFACSPRVTYNANSMRWDAPSSAMALVPGGLAATVTLPNVRLSVNACSTTCCIGGSTVSVSATSIGATISFSLALQGGVLRAALQGTPSITVGTVNLDGSGFCGFLVNLLQGFFTGTVKTAVHDALTSFINTSVAPLLDQLVSSLDVTSFGKAFSVPRLDGPTGVPLQFGLAFSSLNISNLRALLGISTRFTAATVAQNRPSLGVPGRTANPSTDVPGTSGAAPVGLSLYEGVLNQVLHGLWRGGFFQATLAFGGGGTATAGTATIDAELPPVAAISGTTAQLMLGGIQASIRVPDLIDPPIAIVFGGRATASVALDGSALTFGNLSLGQLFVSFQTSLTQSQRTAMENLLGQVFQRVLVDAINGGLPAFPIPTFALPASAAGFGLPAGAQLGISRPTLSTVGTDYVLTGSFGVRN